MSDSKPTDVSASSTKQPHIPAVVAEFIAELDALRATIKVSMPLMIAFGEQAAEKLTEFLKPYQKTDDHYNIPILQVQRFEKLERSARRFALSIGHLPRALLVAMVSAFDTYLGDLLRAVFYLRPEILNSSQRTLTFEDLVRFPSLEQAREFILEKEIESVIRDSHAAQFAWMENRFGIELRKGLASWPHFVELTERRNLFVHCGGVVSTQYLDVCRKHAVELDSVAQGHLLSVDPEYFEKAYRCIFEIGTKLAQVLWRKLAPAQLEQADDNFIEVTFDLLKDRQWELASRLLEFARTLPKYSSGRVRRIFVVNLAIAYLWGGKKNKAISLLDQEDWSDCGEEFVLANVVLREDFELAKQIMLRLGAEAPRIGRVGYETWPLFRDFRKTDQFQIAFKEIYGEAFQLAADSKPREVLELIDENELGERGDALHEASDKTPSP